MKSKVFKFVLPAFAFALAIVASFAFTPAQNGVESTLITGYTQQASSCQAVQVDCNPFGGPACTIGEGQNIETVFRFGQGLTQCSGQLFKN